MPNDSTRNGGDGQTETPIPVFPSTDAGNGERFAHLFGKDIRWDTTRGEWLEFRKHRWVITEKDQMLQLAIKAARHGYHREAEHIPDPSKRAAAARWAILSESKGRLESALALAATCPPIASN